ncbi:hypothetical protein A9976_13090 [Delftia sp. UME58]|nr:hypothetical protein [Delftia sp. UME58]
MQFDVSFNSFIVDPYANGCFMGEHFAQFAQRFTILGMSAGIISGKWYFSVPSWFGINIRYFFILNTAEICLNHFTQGIAFGF